MTSTLDHWTQNGHAAASGWSYSCTIRALPLLLLGERGCPCRVGEGIVSEQPPTDYAPPGWYLDPIGLQSLRWWNGAQWGQQTRPLPGNEQEPQLPYQLQQSYGQPRPARNSWPRRHKVLTVLGSLAALIIVIGGIASTSGSAKQADNSSAIAIAIATPTGTATASRAPTHHGTSTETRPKKAPVTAQATTPASAATTPAPAATASAASGRGHYTCGVPLAEQRRHLLRTRQILPRCRPWGIRDSWHWGSDHLRRQ